jgi:hypothetical protein
MRCTMPGLTSTRTHVFLQRPGKPIRLGNRRPDQMIIAIVTGFIDFVRDAVTSAQSCVQHHSPLSQNQACLGVCHV